MIHREDAIKKAEKICENHELAGLSKNDAIKAAVVTLTYAMSEGLYPAYLSINQRALNYLNDKLTYSMSNGIS